MDYGVIDAFKFVAGTLYDYRDLAKILPQLQHIISVASDSLIAFEANYNTVKACSRLLVNDRPVINWHQIRDIDAFIAGYRRFLDGFKRSCDTSSGNVKRRRKCIKWALTGKAGAGVGGLQQQHQLLMNYMNQLNSYNSVFKSENEESSALDSIHFSPCAAMYYRDPNPVPQLEITITTVDIGGPK